jgi:hypothetical protein
MEHAVLFDEVFVDVREYRITQVELGRNLLAVRGRIGTDRDHLGAKRLNLWVCFLQLTELLAAEPSSLSPVEDNQDRLLSLERAQVDGRALNRKSTDVGRETLGLKRKQQSQN